MATVGAVLHTSQMPGVTANARQALMAQRRYGMFMHYGINTFNDQEWSDGSYSPSIYAPSALNPAQWVATARNAGMTYILAITKHHDGFTMWTSADTTYGVGAAGSGNSTDVIAALATACAADEVAHPGSGVKLALYYSLWDRKRNSDTANTSLDAAYNATATSHLTELLSNYGPICELWLDGEWEKLNTRWGLNEIYKLMRRKQPTCVLGINHTIGDPTLFGIGGGYVHPDSQNTGDTARYTSDFRLDDPFLPKTGTNSIGDFSTSNLPDPKTFVRNGVTYYLPYESTFNLSSSGWFWHATSAANFFTDTTLIDSWFIATGQSNNVVVNVPPSMVGTIDSAHITKINALGTALGLSSGAPLEDFAEGKTCTASSTFSSGYLPNYAVTGQTAGPRWAAANGDTTNPWIYVDLGSAKTVRRVALFEWSFNGTATTTAISIQTSNDATAWTTRTTGSGSGFWLRYGVFSFSPVSARYVRILCTAVNNPPTFMMIRVY